MYFERLNTSDNKKFDDALELYKISFPPHEQRELHSQTEILKDSDYHFNLIYNDDRFVGIILCWETEKFIYVEHFCILPSMRNHSYGTKALELLKHEKKVVILEIDMPVDGVSVKRKAFYERNEFTANNFEHIHPPYHAGNNGHGLMVMSYPRKLGAEEYNDFFDYLKNRVMGDVSM